MEKIIARISRIIGIPNVVELFSRLSSADMQSLLMAVCDRRVANLTPSSIIQQYEESGFLTVCLVPQNRMAAADLIAMGALPDGFSVIELSPVSPFGINAVLTKTNQKKVMATMRGSEVCADPTTALALQCAMERRRKLRLNGKNAKLVKLATAQRCVRTQSFKNISGFTPHFKTFSLATAGRDQGSEMFEKQALIEHIKFYLQYIGELSDRGFHFADISVSLSNIQIIERVIQTLSIDREMLGRRTQDPLFDAFGAFGVDLPRNVHETSEIPEQEIKRFQLGKAVSLLAIVSREVFPAIRVGSPDVTCKIDLGRVAGMGYYSNSCFKITARNKQGKIFPLADGGEVDWTQRLLASKKERAVISGIGTELICGNFYD